MKISIRQLGRASDSLRDVMRIFDQAGKSVQIALPKPKNEIGPTKSKESLFSLYKKQTIGQPKRQIP